MNSNLSENILYLVTFTYKLAKHKTAAPRFLYFIAHESTLFFVQDFYYINFVLVSWEEMTFIWPLKTKCPCFFLYIYW